jgi:hypothetical protein
VVEDQHLRPTRSTLLPLQRFHLRSRITREPSCAHSSDETKHRGAMEGISALGLFRPFVLAQSGSLG